MAVESRVLTKGREEDAVLEGDIPDGEGGEEFRDFCVVWLGVLGGA